MATTPARKPGTGLWNSIKTQCDLGGGDGAGRKLGTGLVIGIIFLPYIFAWFTLRKGYSTKQRFLALGWMVVLFVSLRSGNMDKQAANPSTPSLSTTSYARPTPPPPMQPTPPPSRQPALGEDFQLGDFTYNVKRVTSSTTIGSGFAKKRASEGALFVVVEYTILNESSATETVLADDFRIVDSQKREFRPSSEANTALMMSGATKDFVISEVQPGIKKKMQTAFEMPETSATGGFTLVIPEKGLLGTGSVRISLR
jgi:hypothetical protein